MTRTPTTCSQSVHTFHIPVMGTGFTIDTPLHVAPFGISSVISLVDDVLIEQMRCYHSEMAGLPYEPIPSTAPDARADRITAYLNLLDRRVRERFSDIRSQPFEPDSDIARYFEMLPPSPLRDDYRRMLDESDHGRRALLQEDLRRRMRPGSIDVNIMTKLDCGHNADGTPRPPEFSDALAALRGFARSEVDASVVCSAGMNRGFYRYFAEFGDFYPDANGHLKKRITLKVSNHRSAEIQGRYLAKQGLWVSEYRIESEINCGGHAFVAKGQPMGLVLDEFKCKRDALEQGLADIYLQALKKRGDGGANDMTPSLTITAQGGIGTADEHRMLLDMYELNGTGWGTPFLLVPEAVNLDAVHIDKLLSLEEKDVYLSDCSPLGIPFWNLRTSKSEERRRARIRDNTPGSTCRKGYLRLDTSLGSPLCRASAQFQRRQLQKLDETDMSPGEREGKRERILAKSCICDNLAGAATVKLGIEPDAATAVCCGPNIINFAKIATLKEMTDHIYGRLDLRANPDRPHMFVREIKLYIEYLKKLVHAHVRCTAAGDVPDAGDIRYFDEFRKNLRKGIAYYMDRADAIVSENVESFLSDIRSLALELESLEVPQAAL